MLTGSIGLLAAIPIMGAGASMVNTLPAGTARTMAGTAVGLQSVALVGNSMGNMHKKWIK